MSRFIRFVTNGQFRCFTRTDRWLAVFHLGTTTGGNDIVNHQQVLPRIGQHELSFLLLAHRESTEVYLCLIERHFRLYRLGFVGFHSRQLLQIELLHQRIVDGIANSHYLIVLIQQESLERHILRKMV